MIKGGGKFQLVLTTTGLYEPEAVFIQDQLRRVGINMEIQSLNNQVVRQRQNSGDFEALLIQIGSISAQRRLG